jgi:ABC-2 type transport system ATP-binding protein
MNKQNEASLRVERPAGMRGDSLPPARPGALCRDWFDATILAGMRPVNDPDDAAPAIRLDGLGKRYGRVTALSNVSLDVQPGEIFGFLGLNGAGKTTTIRILLDLVRPTAGRAFVFGADCFADGLTVRAQIGYLPGELGFRGDMTGNATLDFLARLHARRIDVRWRRDLLRRLELAPADLARKVREYSTGMKRKLGIVQAFQSDAPLLILDEPTDGLDPLMQEAVYDLLAEVKRRGRTVFMSSHVLPEVERVCDRIGLLRNGALRLVSSVDEVRHLAARRVRVVFGEPVAAPVEWPEDCEVLDLSARVWHLRVHGPMGPLIALVAPLDVHDIEVHEPHLEEVLRHYYLDETAP